MKVEIPSSPHLPQRISRLGEFSYNLWWSWNADARALFRQLDRSWWARTQHNPIVMLKNVAPERLLECSQDEEFLRLYDSVMARFDRYMDETKTVFSSLYPEAGESLVGYFCAEFAAHSSLPIYSGGLGLLAGDTCKEASDLGFPLVAIGSLYPEGYFRQRIDPSGRQEAIYVRLKTEETALLPVLHDDGSRLLVSVPVGVREIRVAVWKIQVGRVPVYLMDTDIPENEPWDRDVSARLYGGDQQVRLRQEIILGMGGVRVLRALGYQPGIFHLNEGHAAFAALERIRELMHHGLSFDAARERLRETTVFTTHTPVKAGHDEFPFYLIEEHFRPLWEDLGLSRESFLRLGQTPDGQHFSMTILALRTAKHCNGVSRKHGEVTRQMWHFLWPDLDVVEVPIVSITNGVHVPTWLAPVLARVYERHLGPDWLDRHDDPHIWERVVDVPNEELWEAHLLLKDKLIAFVRERTRRRWMEDGLSPGQLVGMGTLLSPDALTIGFARRFATYKRALLVLQDMDRLTTILHNLHRPVQIIFSGKAHPADEPGKFLIQQVYEACASNEAGGRIAFIEDYDKHVAHHLVQGVDVWLNNPEPPQEASGTSGQKASLNGIPNFSILDGWWAEGYNGRNGWAIEDGGDPERTAQSLYRILEQEIVPTYYQGDSLGVPHNWVAVMKEAIRSTTAPFSARRMLKEYAERMYNMASSYSTTR